MEGIVLVAAVLGGLLLFGYRRPGVMLGGALCIYGLEQVAQVLSPFFWRHASFINFAIGGLVMMGLVLALLRGKLSLRNYPANGIAVLFLYSYVVLSLVWSPYRVYGFANIEKHAPYVVFFALMTPLLISETRDLRAGLISTLMIGVPCALFALYFADWGRRGLSFEAHLATLQTGGIAAGYSGNPLALASMGGYVAVISAIVSIKPIDFVWRFARWGVVALGLLLAIQTGSRGQAIGATAVIFLMIPFSYRIRNIKGFLATGFALFVLGVIAMYGFSAVMESERWSLLNMIETYQQARLNTSMMLLDTWWDAGPFYWLFGLGTSASFDPSVVGFYPHNVPLEVLGELGIIGFCIYAAVLILTFRSFWRLVRQLKDFDEARRCVVAIYGLHLLVLILSLKQGSLLGASGLFMTAIVLGMFENSYRRMQQAATLTHAQTVYSPTERVPLATATLPPRRI